MNDSDLTPEARRLALLRIARLTDDPNSQLTEEESGALVDEWDRLCPHPGGNGILFWPNELGLCCQDELGTFVMSPEAMAEYALNWEPRVVAMQVIERSGGESVGYYIYKLVAPGTPNTQVVTALETAYGKGAILAVALKGVRMKDGSLVERSFEFRVFSCGRILGVTDDAVGTRLEGHPHVA